MKRFIFVLAVFCLLAVSVQTANAARRRHYSYAYRPGHVVYAPGYYRAYRPVYRVPRRVDYYAPGHYYPAPQVYYRPAPYAGGYYFSGRRFSFGFEF